VKALLLVGDEYEGVRYSVIGYQGLNKRLEHVKEVVASPMNEINQDQDQDQDQGETQEVFNE